VVEHEIYGQITVDLIINNRQDALAYVEKTKNKNAKPLNILTNGVHYHTIEADSEEVLDRIEEKLNQMGILIQSGE
jgi:transcriptional regulator of NAD metabolism